MREDDLEAFADVTATSYHEVDTRTHQRAWPDPVRRPAARNDHWIRRTRQALVTDPGGCWVAEVDGEVVGGAVSRVRELMWILASFAVRPQHQGRGIGTQLLAAAMHHGRGCLRGMFAASADPGAVRRYRLAGFDLHPQMMLSGSVDRSALPSLERVREAVPGDIALMNSVDRATRGAAHGHDHDYLMETHRALVVDHRTGEGYAYFDERGLALLAATTRGTATQLLWAALAQADGETSVHHVTAANQWAIDVGMAAGLSLSTRGYLGVRGMRPPAPYIHHGSLL
jgi:GNAT superfamily N-acetyltransferase